MSLRPPHLVAVLLALSPFVPSYGGNAVARPLEAEACSKLKGDLAALDDKGVKALIDKGPAQAKDAPREQLRLVRQYFDLLGNFRFRCPQDQPIVVLKQEPQEDPTEAAAAATAPIEAGSAGVTLPAGVAAATVAPVKRSPPRTPQPQSVAPESKKDEAKKPAPKPKSAAAQPTAASQKAAQEAAQPAPQPKAASTADQPRPKPKPKTDDAFRPSVPAPQQ